MRIFLLIPVIFLFVCNGCTNDQYSIEREFWRVKKEAQKIFINPESSPPSELERVTSLLNSLADKHPKTRLALDTQFTVARLYIVKKEYEQARNYLSKLIDKYGDSRAIIAEAMFMAGNAFELENKWQDALANYKKIIAEFPITRPDSPHIYRAIL